MDRCQDRCRCLGPLYWRDQSLTTWTACVLASSQEGIVLDESAFFPGGGGQPADVGQLEWGAPASMACPLRAWCQPMTTRCPRSERSSARAW
jgi:hypothetical protein